MGRKRKKAAQVKPFCYYCDRDFEDEKVLVQHQKAKHFRCTNCHKKMDSSGGVVWHMSTVHKETLTEIPNAKPGRESTQHRIMGMNGVPEDAITEHQAKLADEEEEEEVDEAKKKAAVQPTPPAGMPNAPFPGTMPFGPPAMGGGMAPMGMGMGGPMGGPMVPPFQQQQGGMPRPQQPGPAPLPFGMISPFGISSRPGAPVMTMNSPQAPFRGPMPFAPPPQFQSPVHSQQQQQQQQPQQQPQQPPQHTPVTPNQPHAQLPLPPAPSHSPFISSAPSMPSAPSTATPPAPLGSVVGPNFKPVVPSPAPVPAAAPSAQNAGLEGSQNVIFVFKDAESMEERRARQPRYSLSPQQQHVPSSSIPSSLPAPLSHPSMGGALFPPLAAPAAGVAGAASLPSAEQLNQRLLQLRQQLGAQMSSLRPAPGPGPRLM